MEKVLFYGMTGEKMCFNHILLNALDLKQAGHEVQIIFEGASVQLVPTFEEEGHAPYIKAKEAGLIAGACKACSKMFKVDEKIAELGVELLDDMQGHAGMKKYVEEGYTVVSM